MVVVAINKLLNTLHRKSKEVGIGNIYQSVSSSCKKKNGKEIKEKTFYSKLSPNIEEHKLNVEEFIFTLQALERKDGAHLTVLQDLVSIFGFNLVAVPSDKEVIKVDYKSFIGLWMDFNKEHGDVQTALTSSLGDYKITANELYVIKKEITEQAEAMAKLSLALESACGKRLI